MCEIEDQMTTHINTNTHKGHLLLHKCCICFDSVSIVYQKLDEDDEESYLNSRWADPNALRRSFNGLPDIGWRPK